MNNTTIYIVILFIVIGMSRIIQFWLLERDRLMGISMVYGIIYLLIGIGTLLRIPLAVAMIFIFGLILPVLGVLGGLFRYFKYQRKGIILMNVALDTILFILLINVFFVEQTASFPPAY